MITVISFVIVLGVLIFIHELGHFAIAKMSNIKVEKFSLGFGPRIIGFRKGETEYMLSLLPLGGYVKMIGEAPGEEIADENKGRSFTDKSPLNRALIIAAGPVMNLILALMLFPLIYIVGIEVPAYLERAAAVGYVFADSPADKAGIQKGDTIRMVDGEKTATWEDFITTTTMNPDKPLKLRITRGGSSIDTTLSPGTSATTGAGTVGVLPDMPAVISTVNSGYPAGKAGLRPGDEIIAVNNVKISHWIELEGLVSKDGASKKFTIKRGEKTFDVDITPRAADDGKRFIIGVSREEERALKQYGVGESITKGLSTSVIMTEKLFVVIKGLVMGQYSLKTLGGPIMIAQVAGRAAHEGISDILSLVAFLSLQLGIINLFPIPVLDGGHIMFLAVESIKGKPLSDKFMGVAQQIGIALIITLMVLVTYNDIFRILS
ncbi:MAG: RIP metalloprotease RseP [Thermodesulfobacteriota bacterium]